jgi:hypothetical protein
VRRLQAQGLTFWDELAYQSYRVFVGTALIGPLRITHIETLVLNYRVQLGELTASVGG